MASSGDGTGLKQKAKNLKNKVFHPLKSRSGPSGPPPAYVTYPRDSANTPVTLSSTRSESPIHAILQMVKVATAAAAFFPPAQPVVGGLSGAVDLARAAKENESQRKVVRRTLEEGIRRLQLLQSRSLVSTEMADRVKRLSSEIEVEIVGLDVAMNESWWKRLVEGDALVMAEQYGKLSSKLNTFIVETVIDIDGNIGLLAEVTGRMRLIMSQIQADIKLKELSPVEQAAFDGGPRDLRGPCTPETRTQILDNLMTWVTDDSKPPCYWLCGMAGTGKTTIAYSFCERLREAGLLGANFFCSRTVEATRDARAIIPTIAFSLASCSQASSDAVLSVLQNRDYHGIRSKEIKRQFEALIMTPVKALAASDISKSVVVVCDGLDEADNVKEIADIITLFLELTNNLPIKLFISSRLDEKIRGRFDRAISGQHSTLILHDIEKDIVNRDIQEFVTSRLEEISKDLGVNRKQWISDEGVGVLVTRANTLFVYASALCGYLDCGFVHEAKDRVASILLDSSKPIDGSKQEPYAVLNNLYSQIIQQAYKNDSTDIRELLYLIVVAFYPLGPDAISTLLGINTGRVEKALGYLNSVLTVPTKMSYSQPITIFHASFYDFITTPSRSSPDICLTPSEGHLFLLKQCLMVMEQMLLHNNICQVQNKSQGHLSIPESQIKNHITSALEYACTSWLAHFLELDTEQGKKLDNQITGFFDTRVLRWIECIAWLGKLGDGVNWLRKMELSGKLSAAHKAAVTDTRRAILQCFEVIKDCPLEIYHSALVWLPKKSAIANQFGRWHIWSVAIGLAHSWDPCENILRGHSSWVKSVSFSPDGTRVVSGSSDNTVRIWNVETGEEERRMDGHSSRVNSASFSPDGTRVVSGSDDSTVRVWNVETGEEERRMDGHSSRVNSVTFSPDGTRVVSGSNDSTVRIWNGETGEEERRMDGQSHWFSSVSFSADGIRVVSGSSNSTVQIWNVDTGKEERGMEGHSSWVKSVSFSPDGTRVVSCSDDQTVRTWSVETGKEERRMDGNSSRINSASFSPDGTRVVSGSDDSTVRIWNVETGEEEWRMDGHSSQVNSITFSPDGTRVASGSNDQTVRIWNVETREEERRTEGHSESVTSISFSPDGIKVVSGSSDNIVRIWNVETGEEERRMEGHLNSVNSVSFSPDGARVVSGSDDNTVRIWNVETGEEEWRIGGHSNSVNSVFFSPDGTRVVSESYDGTVRIWNLETGEEQELSASFPASGDNDCLTLHDFWVSSGSVESACWVPYHDISVSTSNAKVIGLGFKNGHFAILKCN